MGYYWELKYPVGIVWVTEEDGLITGLFFANEIRSRKKHELKGFENRESALIKKAAKQLDEYFAGKRREFSLPLKFVGTDFQKKVWEALLTIPYGETRSYSEIAEQVGNPKACRAVGMANNRNPISIICPCHRVIGKNGSLVGYGGGLEIKRILLDLES